MTIESNEYLDDTLVEQQKRIDAEIDKIKQIVASMTTDSERTAKMLQEHADWLWGRDNQSSS